ncbi:hypothetical protein ACEV7R_23580, partial [Vibrio parahaemolyticus]
KMQNLSATEEAVFDFLRIAFRTSPRKMKPEFERLLKKLQLLANDRLETRAFMYLDILSWLESKIQEKPVQTIIRQKYLENKK